MRYIGLNREKREKTFLSKTTKPRTLIFGMKHTPEDLYQICSKYTTGAKTGTTPGVTCVT